VEFIQRLGGYALTGSVKEQKLFYLYGSGANGKSVFLEVLRSISGSYAHNLPSEALTGAFKTSIRNNQI
jgi:putative DNA primase/helicase